MQNPILGQWDHAKESSLCEVPSRTCCEASMGIKNAIGRGPRLGQVSSCGPLMTIAQDSRCIKMPPCSWVYISCMEGGHTNAKGPEASRQILVKITC